MDSTIQDLQTNVAIVTAIITASATFLGTLLPTIGKLIESLLTSSREHKNEIRVTRKEIYLEIAKAIQTVSIIGPKTEGTNYVQKILNLAVEPKIRVFSSKKVYELLDEYSEDVLSYFELSKNQECLKKMLTSGQKTIEQIRKELGITD